MEAFRPARGPAFYPHYGARKSSPQPVPEAIIEGCAENTPKRLMRLRRKDLGLSPDNRNPKRERGTAAEKSTLSLACRGRMPKIRHSCTGRGAVCRHSPSCRLLFAAQLRPYYHGLPC